jgi:potassium efflux system protein
LRLRPTTWLLAILGLAGTGFAQVTGTPPGTLSAAGSEAHQAATTAADSRPLSPPSDADVAALRAEATGQLQALNPSAPASPSPPNVVPTPTRSSTTRPATAGASIAPESTTEKQLRELLQERLQRLDEYDKAASTYKKAVHPEPSPERQADEVRSELVKVQALLVQASSNPEVLLPQAFRSAGASSRPSVNAEMKEAIEAVTGEVKESRAKLEALRSEVVNWEGQQNARRAERDKLYQAVAAMKAQGVERVESAGPATTLASSQRLARERQVNAIWKSRVAAMRLQAIEAQIALEAKLAGVRELSVQVGQAQVQVAEKTLVLMQSRYNAAADRQEQLLQETAAAEASRARRAEDPLEEFRARCRSDLLILEAQVVKFEQALATSPAPSLDEQRSLADHAGDDFARIKALLDDGRVSRLDAIRLNNDFRRIGPERDRLLRNEMSITETRLQYYEDALTAVELELLQDSLHDHDELEALKERLRPARWAEAQKAVADVERAHRALLVRRRGVLEHLADDAGQTHDQIARRLAILDEEYGFIRTHIFWVRDQEPIGVGTISQGARECQHLFKAMLRLAQESVRRRNWGRASAEFVAAALAVLGLPLGLVRLRRLLKAQIGRDLPARRKEIATPSV